LTAARCAEAGLEVLVFEEHSLVGEPAHCTGVVSLETANLAKISNEIVLKRLTRARLQSSTGAACEIAWEAEEQILAIDRAAFDQELAIRAGEAGAVIWTGRRVSDVSIDAGGVTVRAGDRTVRARACVLACGVSYRLPRRLGLGFPAQIAHTAQLEVDAAATDCVELHFGRRVAPSGFAWLVPVVRNGRDRLKIGVLAAGDPGACLASLLERPEISRRLAATPGGSLRRLLPLGVIGKTYAARVLVVGDAGGFTKPTTGGGIFYGLLTAALAAETLIEGFQQGRFDDEFMSRYEARWRARLGPELRAATWFRRVMTGLNDTEIDRFVRVVAADDVQAVIRSAARFNWHRDVILALIRRRRLARLLFGALVR